MIFVTLGSQKFQFNRLLEAIDKLVAEKKIKEKVFAQTGYSDYTPRNYKFKQFLDREEFQRYTENCEVFITHGGTGAIIGAVKKEKKVIAVARLAKYGEHVDDHQLQILEQFKELGLIYACEDTSELFEAYDYVKNNAFKKYESNTDTIIDDIDRFISEI
ncbi:MAG: PssE/Cps14G family polysaccharide biosynthesis glycosyltransferase [Ruminococcus sp.]|nr:PssE/Cps14G family polysaccharide biosynthesis glycosyltransferase [Ruminococcus sp.]